MLSVGKPTIASQQVATHRCTIRQGTQYGSGAALGNHVSEADTSAGKNSCGAAAQLRRLPGAPGDLWQSFAGLGLDLNALPTAVPTVTSAAHLQH